MAMVILAVGLLGVSMMQAYFAQGNAQSRQLTRASDIATNKMEELVNLDYNDLDEEDSPEVITTYPIPYNVTWLVNENSTLGIKDITVEVIWQIEGRNHTVSTESTRIEGF